jgi:hypothetical protein
MTRQPENKIKQRKNIIMKTDVQFALDRANATNTVATAIQADWVWPEKPIAQMMAETQTLTGQASLTDTKNSAWGNAVAQKNAAFDIYHQTTVTLLGMTKTHYRNNPAALATLKNLHARAQSEQATLDEGNTFAQVWAQLDATYVPDTGWTLAAFQTAGADCVTKAAAVTTADVAWSSESAKTDAMALAVEDTNTAWYADATRKFGPDTEQGKTIRQEVPTTSKSVQPPATPVVVEAQALGGGKVHIDFQPPDSGYIQILHQGPAETAFTVLVDKLTADFYEAGGFVVGAHSFKFVGINSGGESDASAPIVIQVT